MLINRIVNHVSISRVEKQALLHFPLGFSLHFLCCPSVKAPAPAWRRGESLWPLLIAFGLQKEPRRGGPSLPCRRSRSGKTQSSSSLSLYSCWLLENVYDIPVVFFFSGMCTKHGGLGEKSGTKSCRASRALAVWKTSSAAAPKCSDGIITAASRLSPTFSAAFFVTAQPGLQVLGSALRQTQ